MMKRCLGRRGFSLTEVLIVIAVLGVISAMMVPKLLDSTMGGDSNGQITKWKNGYQVAEEVLDLYMSEDGEHTNADFKNYFFSKIRAKKKCPNTGVSQGCVTNSYSQASNPMVVMDDGTIITVTSSGGLLVDADGVSGTNTIDQDCLYWIVNATDSEWVWNGVRPAGTITAREMTDQNSASFKRIETIMKRR